MLCGSMTGGMPGIVDVWPVATPAIAAITPRTRATPVVSALASRTERFNKLFLPLASGDIASLLRRGPPDGLNCGGHLGIGTQPTERCARSPRIAAIDAN